MPIKDLMSKHNLNLNDLKPYLPVDKTEMKNKVEVHYLGIIKNGHHKSATIMRLNIQILKQDHLEPRERIVNTTV